MLNDSVTSLYSAQSNIAPPLQPPNDSDSGGNSAHPDLVSDQGVLSLFFDKKKVNQKGTTEYAIARLMVRLNNEFYASPPKGLRPRLELFIFPRIAPKAGAILQHVITCSTVVSLYSGGLNMMDIEGAATTDRLQQIAFTSMKVMRIAHRLHYDDNAQPEKGESFFCYRPDVWFILT